MTLDCGCEAHEERQVDTSTWDGQAAMSRCANSDTPASCYRSICAGRKDGDPQLQASWALPHHSRAGGPPNAAGVRNALSRLSQTQGLTNREEARRHLERHLSTINAETNAAEPPTDDLFRAVLPGYELREDGADGMPTMVGHFAVFNEWTEINSLFEGRFLERIDPSAFNRTFRDDLDTIRVLFQHGRDPMVGDKPLGPIDVLKADKRGAYYEVPLIDTSYNRDLLPALREGLYGASFRFTVDEEHWSKEPERSRHNPDGLPERTILDATVPEFGPVTFPAYAGATAGVRSLTDRFRLDHTDLTGRPDAASAGGGDSDAKPGAGDAPTVNNQARTRDRVLRMTGVIT